ncbi:MAG: NAD(P)/FAD-dependent oxidoreductase [Gammaproteobacteria bacterium]
MNQSPTSSYDVVILGAGAAGLFCASTAAKRGRRVLVLEKANRIGKKTLMSGGGRCNFTNQFVEADNFISGNPHFCKSALSTYSQWDFIGMVEQYRIEYEQRKHGQLFCIHSAKDIVSMLQAECERFGVAIRTHCEVKEITCAESDSLRNRYQIEIAQGAGEQKSVQKLCCQSLVIATGGLSVPTLGGSGIGYEIARQFNLEVTERRSGLVPFVFTDAMKPLCERLSGSSLEVEIRCNGRTFTEQLLFTHRGMSGPAVLQISSYWREGDAVEINLLPAFDATAWLLQAKRDKVKTRLKTFLNQKFTKSLAVELQSLWWPQLAEIPLLEFSDKRLRSIGQKINRWLVTPSGTEGYRTAEVTLGGVDTNGISSKTMEAKNQTGLYFIGEVLDVSGHLGGFNFQWAWSSAYVAGQVV